MLQPVVNEGIEVLDRKGKEDFPCVFLFLPLFTPLKKIIEKKLCTQQVNNARNFLPVIIGYSLTGFTKI